MDFTYLHFAVARYSCHILHFGVRPVLQLELLVQSNQYHRALRLGLDHLAGWSLD
jgi:hypothetical protein